MRVWIGDTASHCLSYVSLIDLALRVEKSPCPFSFYVKTMASAGASLAPFRTFLAFRVSALAGFRSRRTSPRELARRCVRFRERLTHRFYAFMTISPRRGRLS